MGTQEAEVGGMRIYGKSGHTATSRTAKDSQKDLISKTKGSKGGREKESLDGGREAKMNASLGQTSISEERSP